MEKTILSDYYNLSRLSPAYRKMQGLLKKELVDQVGTKLWVERKKIDRLVAVRREVAILKLENMVLADILYRVEWMSGSAEKLLVEAGE